MNATERRAEIFNLLQKDGSADLNELAEKLAVSSMTVRRDLQIFEHQGLVITEGLIWTGMSPMNRASR